MEERYHEKLQRKASEYAHLVYRLTKKFPKEEIYGTTSQLRRAALSAALNYVEGYARGKNNVHKNFLEISYGSLKESMYLLEFSHDEGYMAEEEYQKSHKLGGEIGAMLWGIISKL